MHGALQPATLATRISWTPAASKPDADITYLLVVDDNDGHREWFSGWWDGYFWRDCASGGIMPGTVVFWGEPALPGDPVSYREEFPEDSPTVVHCDDAGTGEGRHHGRV